MQILQAADFINMNLAPLGAGERGRCFDQNYKPYYVKRASYFYLTPLREYADPQNWKDEESADPVYANLSAIWEVCFAKFAKLIMPNIVPETDLLQQGDDLLVASERVHLFTLIMNTEFTENAVILTDKEGSNIQHYFAESPPKIKGPLEIMIVSEFLGDNDYLNTENMGLYLQGYDWIAQRLDFDSAGVFTKEWDIEFFLKNLEPKRFGELHKHDNPTFVAVLKNSDFEEEKTATLNKLASFDINLLDDVWHQFKPLLLREAAKIADPIISARTQDYIRKDSPIMVLRERQAQVQDHMANVCSEKDFGFTAMIESERGTYRKWQEKNGSRSAKGYGSMSSSVESRFSRVS